jgi:hypothetical protein
MTELFLHGKQITTVFELLGKKENDITYSLGWALSRSHSFLRRFLMQTIEYHGEVSQASILLQHYQKAKGTTDIEIDLPGQFHIIVEAKRGWRLPNGKQLEKYALRLANRTSPKRRMLVLSECSPEYAEHHLKCKEIHQIPIQIVSWKQAALMARISAMRGNHAEKRLLKELHAYLRRATTMQDIESNRVYVVALASGTRKGWGISWIDMVNKRMKYFHRMGVNGWPKEPPNYIAFRYRGKLQTIHHIESYKVITDLHEAFREIPSKECEPFYLYTLGAAIVPRKEVRTGKIFANGRVWCMLDTLLTCQTIAEARDLSKRRKGLAKAGK